MAQIVTTLLTNVPVGVNGSPGSNESRTTLDPASTVVGLNAVLTNGPEAMPINAEMVKIFIVVSSFFFAPDQVMKYGAHTAKCLEVRPDVSPSGFRLETSDLIPAVGNHVYVWIEHPKLPAPATLSVNLIEY